MDNPRERIQKLVDTIYEKADSGYLECWEESLETIITENDWHDESRTQITEEIDVEQAIDLLKSDLRWVPKDPAEFTEDIFHTAMKLLRLSIERVIAVSVSDLEDARERRAMKTICEYANERENWHMIIEDPTWDTAEDIQMAIIVVFKRWEQHYQMEDGYKTVFANFIASVVRCYFC